jgi:hypothetical protein
MENSEPKHPSLFTIFLSNNIAEADKSQMVHWPEYNIYNHVININHRKIPNQLDFLIDDDVIFEWTDSANLLRKKKNLRERIQNIAFVFEEDFMKKYFNEKVDSRIIPFPKVDILDNQIRLTMQQEFKWILLMIEGEYLEKDPMLEKKVVGPYTGFLKGDAETLGRLKNVISNPFYWLIRKKQKILKEWKVTPDQLRKELFIAKQYKKWDDLKTRVIDPVMEDFIGEWTEFSYSLTYSGRGKKVTEITFVFKKGPEDEQLSPSTANTWESQLIKEGVAIQYVNEIRQRIKTKSLSENGFQWSIEYVLYSLEAAKMEIGRKAKTKFPVKHPGRWIYDGLKTGRWVTEYAKKLNALIAKTQPELPFASYENVDTDETAAKVVKEALKKHDEPEPGSPEFIAEYARKMRQLKK